MERFKEKDFYEKLIEKILKTDFEKRQKIEIFELLKDGMERVNCSNCAYGYFRTNEDYSDGEYAICKYSDESVYIRFDEAPDKRFYAECPYEKLYTECEKHIKRINK